MRIIGMMVVGPGEADRYLEESLKEIHRLCDDALICCNNTDEKTERLISSYAIRWYRDDREWGRDQPRIKESLARRLGEFDPDYVLAFDADEVFDSGLSRDGLERLARLGQHAWYFYLINLWDDPEHHRPELAFWNVRFWSYKLPLEWDDRNLHCGLAPKYGYHHGRYAPYVMKHYGLMTAGSRAKKVRRYQTYDPRAQWKAKRYYDWLASDKPGEPFDEDKWRKMVQDEVETYKQDKIPTLMRNKPTEWAIIEREDGSRFDQPVELVSKTLKAHPTWKVASAAVPVADEAPEEAPVETQPVCEKDTLRAELDDAGIKWDGRWGLKRLREEAAKIQ